MPNVWAAAGGAARAENDLNMLSMAARNAVRRENDLPNKMAKEKDVEFNRLIMNQLETSDKVNEDAKSVLMATKLAIGFIQLLAGGVEAIKNASKAAEAGADAAQTAEEAALQTQKAISDAISATLGVGNMVMQLIALGADRDKIDSQKKTLRKEHASVDAATQALDSSGRA